MTNILVAGAGKSATWLIKYLLDNAPAEGWQVTIADGNAALIREKTAGYAHAKTAAFDITSDGERQALVREADIVLSLMPPGLHVLLAKDCLQLGRHIITSSYISPEMKALDAALREKGLMAMCEMGLDPGIDHMTAHQIIHHIRDIGGKLMAFSSYCGGLIAPASDDNPWHYKFSWNPRNIIDAGKAGAVYLKDGVHHEVTYDKIFADAQTVAIDGLGSLAWYPNRDSISYLESYEVPDVTTFLRATLRYPQFCKGWDTLRMLGMTDWEQGPAAGIRTYREWMNSLRQGRSFGPGLEPMLEWLGLFSEAPLPPDCSSHAAILLDLLERRWAMQPEDRDMVVMQHEVAYRLGNEDKNLVSSMVLEGEGRELSAMAKTVGLPMGLLARGVLNGSIMPVAGVHIPNMPSVYEPVLSGLENLGIRFRERSY